MWTDRAGSVLRSLLWSLGPLCLILVYVVEYRTLTSNDPRAVQLLSSATQDQILRTTNTVTDIGSPSPTNTLLPDAFLFSSKDAAEILSCSQIPVESLRELQNATRSSIRAYYKGEIVSEDDKLVAPSRICIITTVVQKVPAKEIYWNSPVHDKWPDTIHLYIDSSSVRISVPPLRALPTQPNAQQLFSEDAILYYAEIELRDSGSYYLHAEQEASNWSWAFHGWDEATTETIAQYSTAYNRLNNGSSVPAADDYLKKVSIQTVRPITIQPDQFFPDVITVSAPTSTTRQPPYCWELDTFDMTAGRWYNEEHQGVKVETTDDFGYSYEPDECRLDYFSDADTIHCLAHTHIHTFGDSNGRRFMKMILSGGRWCHNSTDTCQGGDAGSFMKLVDVSGNLVEKIEGPEHPDKFGVKDTRPFDFGDNAKLWFSFLTSVAYDPQTWLSRLYDSSDYSIPDPPKDSSGKTTQEKRPFDPSYIARNARSRPLPGTEEASLVIVSLSSWDDAYDQSFAIYERALTVFRDSLFNAYPSPKTQFFLRMNQGYCCRGNTLPLFRLWSGTRNQHFGDIARKVFRVKGGGAMDGRMKVLDASALTGRPEIVKLYSERQISNNHNRAAQIRTETQVMLNALCRRDDSSRAIWKSHGLT